MHGSTSYWPGRLVVGSSPTAGAILTHEVESSRPTAASMREGLTEALDLTKAITDDFHRRRRARAWLGAGKAALGCGDDGLAQKIATAIAPNLQELQAALRERPWADTDGLMDAVRTGARGNAPA
jgi:hypothetical protein